jgi:hypothetical protein
MLLKKMAWLILRRARQATSAGSPKVSNRPDRALYIFFTSSRWYALTRTGHAHLTTQRFPEPLQGIIVPGAVRALSGIATVLPFGDSVGCHPIAEAMVEAFLCATH